MSGIVAMAAMTSPEPSAPIELDRVLVRRVVAGDRPAARRFIGRHQRMVASLLRRMLRPSGLDHLCEDIAQETFVRALGALPRFDVDGPAKVSTWILTIATRLCLQTLQRKRLKTEALSDDQVTGGPRADAAHERAALGRAIERAVAQLPAPHRAAFVLREYHELSYQEIAETLDVDLGTVKSRLSRAKTALRRALKPEAS
jgi:RNA polymerase sigma-70 factor (ECF subfamily)